MTDSPPERTPGDERLQEALMYLERQVDQLAESVTDLSSRLTQFGARLARIEAQVEGLAAPKDADDSPGPDELP